METFIKILTFFSENWKVLIGAAVGLISAITTLVGAIKTKQWNVVREKISEFVQAAEKLNTEGVVKKEIVLAKTRTLFSQLYIHFDEKKVDSIIESIVQISKTINPREKDLASQTEEAQS